MLLFVTWQSFSQYTTKASTLFGNALSPVSFDISDPYTSPAVRKANASFVILCRNWELEGIIQSVRQIEDRFNRNFGYPYVFLNEESFSEEFQMQVSRCPS